MSINEFTEEVNWDEVLGEVGDSLPEYDSSDEWREAFDYALGIKSKILESGVMPPDEMPEKVFEMLKCRKDGYFADLVQERWEKVIVPYGFTQAILVSEIQGDYPLGKVSCAEVTQNSAQCIMNLCAVLQERDGKFFIPSTFIGNWLGIKQQTASMILKRLEKHGYLVRVGSHYTPSGHKTPLWTIGDGIPIKKQWKPKKPVNP